MATLRTQTPVKRSTTRSPASSTSKSEPRLKGGNGTRFWLVFAGALLLAGGVLFLVSPPKSNGEVNAPPQVPANYEVTGSVTTSKGPLTLADIPFNGERAYEHLVALCDLGPRKSGSEAMLKQQAMLREHFTAIGGQVEMQEFQVFDPQDRTPVTMRNIIVHWHPERKERILLCAHYDTRPFPDSDRQNPRGAFIGANDGASGTALLCELGRSMPALESKYGVDFVLFDGEELVYTRRDKYFLGSTHFAQQYVRTPPPYKYVAGILLDMVGDTELHIYYEKNSLKWPDTRPMVQDIWRLADKLGVDEFVPRPRHEISDDHLPLRNTARIPTLDIIDFDYPRPGAPSYWHTTQDTADKCSALSLAKVGWVVHEWLKVIE